MLDKKIIFKSIPGNRNLSINLNGLVVGNKPSVVVPIISVSGTVKIKMFNIEHVVKIDWLKYIAWFEFPDIYEIVFDVTFAPINNQVFKQTALVIPVFSKLHFYKNKYRVIPNCPRYGVSEKGFIYDSVMNRIFKTNKTIVYSGGYPKVNLYVPDIMQVRSVPLHRLIGLTWLSNHNYVERASLNHIDGNKTNFKISNLEWCNQQENCVHAVNIGLNITATKCKVLDVLTGDISEFNSGRQASYFIYNGAKTRINALVHRNDTLYNNRFEIRFIGDTTPWYNIKPNNITKFPGHVFYLYDTNTGEKTTIYGLENFRNKFKLWKLNHKIDLYLKVVKEKYPNLVIKNELNLARGPYQLCDIEDKKVYEFNTMSELSTFLKIDVSRIQDRIKFNKKTLLLNKYLVRKKSDDEFDFTGYVKFYGNTARYLEMRDKVGNLIKEYQSLKLAVLDLKISRHSIKKAIINKTRINNKYYLQYKK